jgi:hypothetical protein
MIRPHYPVLDYLVNYDYIATQLCENKDQPILDCNGKCYLIKELEKSNPSHPLMPKLELKEYIANEILAIEFRKNTIIQHKKMIYHRIKKSEKGFLDDMYRPPALS